MSRYRFPKRMKSLLLRLYALQSAYRGAGKTVGLEILLQLPSFGHIAGNSTS